MVLKAKHRSQKYCLFFVWFLFYKFVNVSCEALKDPVWSCSCPVLYFLICFCIVLPGPVLAVMCGTGCFCMVLYGLFRSCMMAWLAMEISAWGDKGRMGGGHLCKSQPLLKYLKKTRNVNKMVESTG